MQVLCGPRVLLQRQEQALVQHRVQGAGQEGSQGELRGRGLGLVKCRSSCPLGPGGGVDNCSCSDSSHSLRHPLGRLVDTGSRYPAAAAGTAATATARDATEIVTDTGDMHAREASIYAANTPRRTIWIRDLTEEGIEPNPGPPRVCSKNLDGLTGRFGETMYKIKQTHAHDPILALCLQEHHIS